MLNVHGPTISGVRLRAVEQCFAAAGHRRSATKLRGDEGRRPFLHHHLVERLQLGVLARGCTFAAEEESNSVDASLLGGRGRHLSDPLVFRHCLAGKNATGAMSDRSPRATVSG